MYQARYRDIKPNGLTIQDQNIIINTIEAKKWYICNFFKNIEPNLVF